MNVKNAIRLFYIGVDIKKENDYWTTTLKRIRTCTCRHTHDTFKNYHILNNKMYKERKQENKKDVKANHYYCDTHKLQNNAQLDI